MLTLPLCCLIPFQRGFSTESKDSIPYGVAASARAAIARALMVRTFCCSSTRPEGKKTDLRLSYIGDNVKDFWYTHISKDGDHNAILTMLDNLHQAAEMGQDSTAHENSDLLYDLDTRVTSLPGFLALANSLEERQERWNAQGRRYNGESTGCRVSHILVHVVNIRPHGGDHSGQTSSLLLNKCRFD